MKGLQVTKKVRSYEKGTKLQKRYEITKRVRSFGKETKTVLSYEKVRSYEKGTKLRKSYEVTNMVRSYEKGTNMLRNKLRKALFMKFPSYEIVTPPIRIMYYDV